MLSPQKRKHSFFMLEELENYYLAYMSTLKLKAFTSAIAGLFLSTASAQITIMASDLAAAGDTFRISTATGSINLTRTGADQVWNFGDLQAESQELLKYSSPIQSPYVIYFAGNSNLCQPESWINVPGNFISNPYTFYKSSAGSLILTGRGAQFQGLPIGLVLAKKDTMLKFPLRFGNEFAGSFEGNVSLASIGSLSQSGRRQTVADGWGKITTPLGTFDCLRVKSEVQEIDSIVFNGLEFPLPNNRTEYRWYAKGGKFPILEVIVPQNPLAGGTVIRYKDRYRPELNTSLSDLNGSRKFSIYPNPAQHKLELRGEFPSNTGFQLMDLSGKVLKEERLNGAQSSVSIGLDEFPPGMYLLKSQTATWEQVDRIVIAR